MHFQKSVGWLEGTRWIVLIFLKRRKNWTKLKKICKTAIFGRDVANWWPPVQNGISMRETKNYLQQHQVEKERESESGSKERKWKLEKVRKRKRRRERVKKEK